MGISQSGEVEDSLIESERRDRDVFENMNKGFSSRLPPLTKRKQDDDKLRASEQKFRSLFESSRDAIMTAEPSSWRFTSGNEAAVKMFGAKNEEEFISYAPWELSPERQPDGRISAEKAKEMIETAMREGSHFFEWTHRRIGGEEFPADVLLTRIKQGTEVILQATVRDITERKHVEKLNTLLGMAVNQASETIVITDTHGTIIYANPAFEKSTGYTRAEAIGQNSRLLKSGQQDAEFYRRMWDSLGRGEIWHGHFVNRRKDGTLYEEEATISPVRNVAGKTVNYVAVKRDVTREVQLEAQYRQAQKMEAIGQLAGGVAHDFNNILAATMMQAELGESIENLPEEARECLQEIRAYTERAANLTRQLLLFSRREIMQPRDLDLNEVVTGLAKMLQRIIGEDVRLQLNLCPTPLMTHADAGMIDQVLMNLAVNSRDAMSKGGRLLIETAEKNVDESAAQLNAEAPAGRYVCLTVSDTGGGIPPEILPRIFEPFFTTKESGKGTGLGLATVFGIVKQHKGWLKVDNKPGQGVSFQIFLPACLTAAANLPEATARPKLREGTETILLVEDNWTLRTLTRTILTRHGYKVLEASNGVQAKKVWQEHRATVALLLTDLVMPAGLNGLELAKQLHADQPHLKVIFNSGYSRTIDGQELHLCSGEKFLQKPCAPDKLLEAIRQCLDER